MKATLEGLWYGFSMSVLYHFLDGRYIHNVGTVELFVVAFISYLLGDYLMVRYDRWRIKRRVHKEIIKAIKAQGLNPKDFDIRFGKVKITRTDDPDYDALKLTVKKKKKDD